MIVFCFLAILAAASAKDPMKCQQKNSFTMFTSENPVEGSCEAQGLGWEGRDPVTANDKDQFFTKWNDFFLKPECIGKIEIRISEEEDGEKNVVADIDSFDKKQALLSKIPPTQS